MGRGKRGPVPGGVGAEGGVSWGPRGVREARGRRRPGGGAREAGEPGAGPGGPGGRRSQGGRGSGDAGRERRAGDEVNPRSQRGGLGRGGATPGGGRERTQALGVAGERAGPTLRWLRPFPTPPRCAFSGPVSFLACSGHCSWLDVARVTPAASARRETLPASTRPPASLRHRLSPLFWVGLVQNSGEENLLRCPAGSLSQSPTLSPSRRAGGIGL